MVLPDGKKYVQADRQVIFGNDPDGWAGQIEGYINRKIRNGEDVILTTDSGDVLKITGDTAGKASFRNYVRDENGAMRRMTDAEYEAKLNAEAHIDELAQISERINKKPRTDETARNGQPIHGELARNGWIYRKAEFRDFDGQRYRVTISTADGNNGVVVYNVGKMQRRGSPAIKYGSSDSVTETGAQQGKSSSTVTIRQTEGNSQEKSSGKASVEVENRDSDNGNAASDNGKREPKYTVIDGGDTAGKESALAEAYDKAVKQGKGVEISEADLIKYQDIRDDPEQTLIEAVKKYYEESLKGTSVEVTANDGVVEIRFENDGKKKSVGWRMRADKAATFEKLHQLTENAEYAYSEVNRNENERTSIPMFHYFVNNAKIAGRDIPVKIQVRDVITRANSKETRYYTHTLEKNMRGNSGPVAGTQGANIDSNAIAPYKTNIRSTAGNSQENSSGRASTRVESRAEAEWKEAEAYRDAYASIYDFENMSEDEIEKMLTEEIAADAYAGLNWFSGDAQVQEAVRAETERNAPAQRAEAQQETTGPPKGRAQAFAGYDAETGRGIYRSNFEENTPKAKKSERVIRLIQDVWSKNPIDLVVENEDGSKSCIATHR